VTRNQVAQWRLTDFSALSWLDPVNVNQPILHARCHARILLNRSDGTTADGITDPRS